MAPPTIYLISITLVSLATLSLTTAIGCTSCLNQNIDDVRYGCLVDCHQAFTRGTTELGYCTRACSDFVFTNGCCPYGTCISNSTCLANLPSFNFTRSADSMTTRSKDFRISDGSRNMIHDVRKSSQAVVAAMGKAIKPRLKLGNICCAAVQKVLDAAAPDLEPLLHGQFPQDVQDAGMILMSFGFAGSVACNSAFGLQCFFKAMTETRAI